MKVGGEREAKRQKKRLLCKERGYCYFRNRCKRAGGTGRPDSGGEKLPMMPSISDDAPPLANTFTETGREMPVLS